MMALPDYVNYGGSLRLTQPYLAQNVGFYGFVLKTDMAALQKTIDIRLNAPAGGAVRFEPLGPFVILAFNALQQLSSKNPPDSNKGSFSEKECALWVPVIDRVQDKTYWFHPYIFVDNPYALALGREVYGFPKSLGVFNIPDTLSPTGTLSMQTWTLPKYSPDTRGSLAQLVEVGPVPQPVDNQAGVSPWNPIRDLKAFTDEIASRLRSQDSILDDIEVAIHVVEDLINRRAPMVFLKQIPDVADPTKACYLSLIEAPSNMTGFNHGGLLHQHYQATFTPYDSHPIAADLGFTSATVPSVVSFYVEFNFEIDGGIEIWRANTD